MIVDDWAENAQVAASGSSKNLIVDEFEAVWECLAAAGAGE